MSTRATVARYYIQYQWKVAGKRVKAKMPKLFHTKEYAWSFFHSMPDPFINLHHHKKLTASVEYIRIPKPGA